ncbi:hypothetical protein [Streptomyces sp. NPDC049555]|uniref:hypothetical protein n=1 Tax=Streptomyces sp. NPDC049555 TaxID=3154930 RepID=UPI00343C53AF
MTGSPISMTESPSIKITPSLAFVAGVNFTVGMHYGDEGAVAQVLMTHMPPRGPGETPEWVDTGMRALAVSLGLGPITEEPADVGPRLSLHRGVAELDYGDKTWRLRIESPGQAWMDHAAAGGPVRLLVAFEPSTGNRTQDEWAKYVEAACLARTIRWGTTSIRRRVRLR